MPSPSRKSDWPIIAVLVAPVILLAAYGWGYFAWSGLEPDMQANPPRKYWRLFGYPWQASMYQPAASIESLIRRCEVESATLGDKAP
jgi:hypothetical protein